MDNNILITIWRLPVSRSLHVCARSGTHLDRRARLGLRRTRLLLPRRLELRPLLVDLRVLQRAASDCGNSSHVWGHGAALAMVLLIIHACRSFNIVFLYIHQEKIKTELRPLLMDIWVLQRAASDCGNSSHVWGHGAALAMVLLNIHACRSFNIVFLYIHQVKIKTELRPLQMDIWVLQRAASDCGNSSHVWGHWAALSIVLLHVYSRLLIFCVHIYCVKKNLS
jgi:hypothetical protein